MSVATHPTSLLRCQQQTPMLRQHFGCKGSVLHRISASASVSDQPAIHLFSWQTLQSNSITSVALHLITFVRLQQLIYMLIYLFVPSYTFRLTWLPAHLLMAYLLPSSSAAKHSSRHRRRQAPYISGLTPVVSSRRTCSHAFSFLNHTFCPTLS